VALIRKRSLVDTYQLLPSAFLAELRVRRVAPARRRERVHERDRGAVGRERGVCARSAIGVAELPNGLAVEVEAIVALVG
jgi:enamine deaminase RidA (YjgF/YER057c/UK114 family)